MNGSILITDLETTHRDVDKAGACQVAAVMISEDQTGAAKLAITPLFQTYARPSEPMSPEAQAVHGITPDMYQYAPSDGVAIWTVAALVSSLPQPVVMSGYNCTRYDYQLMNKIYPQGHFNTRPQIDVMTLMMRKDPAHGLKLVEVFERMFPDDPIVKIAHDAMADCWMTAKILVSYMNEYQAWDPMMLATYCNTPIPTKIMPWGKYKNKPMDKIPFSYLQWMAANWDDMHPDLAAALQRKGLRLKGS
jgi:hypothetical protein